MKILPVFLTLLFLKSPYPEHFFSLEKADNKTVTVYPEVSGKAFPNPLKGFRSSTVNEEHFPTLTRLYVKWNEIENSGNDGVDKIISYCDERWKDLSGRNVKVIPRVYLEWPYNSQNEQGTRDTVYSNWKQMRIVERYWPADMKKGDYSSEQFRTRLLAMVKKMGQAWDNDPRVAFIEMGLIGWWGEQHSPFVSPEMQVLLGDAFTSAFKNKLVMVRQADNFVSYPFGEYWDSFAHAGQTAEAEKLLALGDKWKTTVRGGEVAYDWGDRSKAGASPDESLKNRACLDHIIDNVRTLHWNHLGWINRYNASDPDVRAGADELQKVLGYRFVIEEVSYTPDIKPGNVLKVNLSVRNVGSSPFYYNWPVEVSLLDPASKKPVWKDVFNNTDIRTWLPGDKWDIKQRKYMVGPDPNQVSGEFSLPRDLNKGEYILALAILDPAGNVPAVRFAVKNYFKDGRHPMGKVGVGKKLRDYKVDGGMFED